jgi:ABC-2 type transport system permease protein
LAASARLGPFLLQEYRRLMRTRLAVLIWAVLLYSVLAVPFLLARPPPEVLHSIASWLGPEGVPAKLVLFVWVDTVMNKLSVILGPLLAGGIVAEERARGTLDIIAAKPIRAADYFTIKLAAAAGALVTFYLTVSAGALLTFPWRVQEFVAGDFVALSSVHLFAALFGVTFSAIMAISFERRLTAMLVSVAVLGALVGLAFLGFIYPTYREVSYLNPFFLGILPIGSIGQHGTIDLALPILALLAFNFAGLLLGRRLARHVLEEV